MVESTSRFSRTHFTSSELDRSIPLNPHRELQGGVAEALVTEVLSVLEMTVHRQRSRRPADLIRLKASASCLLANILVAARNHVDTHRFVAISFNRNDYVSSHLSAAAVRVIRDGLLREGMVEGQAGYRRSGAAGHSRRTRLRATPKLIAVFDRYGVDRKSLGWKAERDNIVLKAPDGDPGPEPPEVAASRATLRELSAQIARSSVVLPDEAWERVAARYLEVVEIDSEVADERVYAGDLTATNLYRGFKGGWDRGGRIYGGWWINLPKVERRNLTIDGSPVSELDFGRLHPTLLFARAGVRLDFDPYLVPGIEGRTVRELGKRTFNRLVNKTPKKIGRDVRLRATELDQSDLPAGIGFQAYLNQLIERLGPISPWFGTGEGIRLQREDSDLAVAVLGQLAARDVLALPVHDSFIVKREHELVLRLAMQQSFEERYGFAPIIR